MGRDAKVVLIHEKGPPLTALKGNDGFCERTRSMTLRTPTSDVCYSHNR